MNIYPMVIPCFLLVRPAEAGDYCCVIVWRKRFFDLYLPKLTI